MRVTVPPRLARAWARSSRFLPAVTGTVTSVALATSLHQPVLLLGALSALVLVGPVPHPAGPPATAPPDEAASRCPPDVRLGDLPEVPPPIAAAVTRTWRTHRADAVRLAAPLGAGPDGVPVVVDLVRHGPHLLVAGTTGSGKSELLTTLVLGLALAHPPDRLAVLLVDFKGGTGLPALTGLPHVVGHLSDLDAAGARRTLRGLFAELRRRERILGAAGARDLRDLDPADPATPPRLLVVIDEFRVLADELPDLLGGLARLAAQGRSLGVHLVLATQRPSGAVPPDLRANVALRLVLRVAEPADSVDLVGVGDAAAFDRPGLALLSRGAGRPEPLQVARAVPRGPATADPGPTRPAGAATSGRTRGGLRRARASSGRTAVPPGRAARRPPAGREADPPERVSRRVRTAREGDPAERVSRRPTGWTPAARERDDGPGSWVAAIRTASAGLPYPRQPWLPPLPRTVVAGDVPAGDGLPVALADLPDELARGPVRWDPDAGHLLVLGGPGSGRSTALSAVAAAAVADGRDVHTVGLPPALVPPGAASALAGGDVTRVARLVRLLARSTAPSRPVLVVDDVAGALTGLAAVARGAGAEALEQLWSSAGGPVAVVAAGAVGSATSRLAPCFADRLVLGSPDPASDQLAGVPVELAGARPVPGRAVHVGRHGAALCQVALPSPPPAVAQHAVPAFRVRPLPDEVPADSLPAPSGRVPPLPDDVPADPLPTPGDRVPPPPDDVPAGSLRAPEGPLVAIGLGGDDAGPVRVDLSRPLLVVGPPGSGRTTALQVVAAAATKAGLRVVGELPAPTTTGGTADAEGAACRSGTAADETMLLVVDDLDELEARDPAAADALVAHLTAGGRIVAATTTAHAVAAFRGPVPALLRARRLLVLDLTEPGSVDLLGPEGGWLADPRRHPPGRGALRLGRDVLPVQVAATPRSSGGPGPSTRPPRV